MSSLARLTPTGGVHGNVNPSTSYNARMWRDKPLLKFAGVESYFRTGTEAVQILVNEANRRDGDKALYLEQFEAMMRSLTPVFDRAPRYAWLAKAFLEPERTIEFRVSFLDDTGSVRTHRGYRIQYSSTLGPYEGPLHFGTNVTAENLKSMALASNFSHALAGSRLGGAAGGANFDPSRSSDAEIQRFCQAYMGELVKYIGPGTDLPSIGLGVGRPEVGYLYGHYKRTSNIYSGSGRGLLWGGAVPHVEAYGYGVVQFAKHHLTDRGDSLEGKRCLITGSGKIALAVAERLLAHGALPICLSDTSGFICEPQGINEAKFQKLYQIKQERGARIGRYIIASTTAKYFDNTINIFQALKDGEFGNIDLIFPASTSSEIDNNAAGHIADAGCQAVFDAAHAPCLPSAVKTFRKLGIAYAPYKATLAAGACIGSSNTDELSTHNLLHLIDDLALKIYKECSNTATEYNVRGDLNAGADIASFLRVANIMEAHGAT